MPNPGERRKKLMPKKPSFPTLAGRTCRPSARWSRKDFSKKSQVATSLKRRSLRPARERTAGSHTGSETVRVLPSRKSRFAAVQKEGLTHQHYLRAGRKPWGWTPWIKIKSKWRSKGRCARPLCKRYKNCGFENSIAPDTTGALSAFRYIRRRRYPAFRAEAFCGGYLAP